MASSPSPLLRQPKVAKTAAVSFASSSWSDLPDLLLLFIASRLLTLRDFAAFSSVCRRWRRLCSPLHLPPLLLDSPLPLLTTPTLPTLHYKARLPNLPLITLLASSHGHLIFLDAAQQPPRALVADPLTGSRINSPLLPASPVPYFYAALSAAPSCSTSVLLLFSSRSTSSQFHYSRIGLGQAHWHTCPLSSDDLCIAHVASFKGRLLAINDSADKLLEFEFPAEDEKVSVKISDVSGAGRPGLVFDRTHFGPRLVECGRDLLLLLFVQEEEKGDVTKVECYRMDFEKMAWVEVKRLLLHDYALFVDCAGKSAACCYKPARWGGMGGCVYLAGPGCDTWIQLPVGDGAAAIRCWPGWDSPVSAKFMAAPRWPSPVWVYPSMFF